jgi:hypothetical protein
MITFHNSGALDPRSFTTFGLNAKTGTSPIGQFGTGLKYAIAGVLRLGGKIAIEVWDENECHTLYDFFVEPSAFRGKDINQVEYSLHEEGEFSDTCSAPFTTELGAHWQPWMIFRELYSNAKDEGGGFELSASPIETYPCTSIIVECPELEAVAEDLHQYFLEANALAANTEIEVHHPQDCKAIYYRGIRVAEMEHASQFSYNIVSPQLLTEDRTLDRWTVGQIIAKGVALLEDRELAEKILLSTEPYERNLNFDYVKEFSPTVKAVLKLKEANKNARKRARQLYSDDYAPTIRAMTEEESRRAEQSLQVIDAFGVRPWTDIRIAEPTEDFDTEQMASYAKVLYVGPSLFSNPQKWLPALIHQWREDVMTVQSDWNRRYIPHRIEKHALRNLSGCVFTSEVLDEFTAHLDNDLIEGRPQRVDVPLETALGSDEEIPF